jgi:hypothetical protein
VSLDSSVVVDFYLTGNLTLLEGLFAGRMLVSNFVTNELSDSNIQVNSAEVVVLSADDEWDFLNDLRKRKGSCPVLRTNLDKRTPRQAHSRKRNQPWAY